MTCESDFDLKDIGTDKYLVDIILPDERLTYYSLASLYTKQQYNALVEYADTHGGTLETRVDFLCDEFGNYAPIDRHRKYAYSCKK
jgi:type IV secretion system protein VirD4